MNLKLMGLDYYNKDFLKNYWENYNPKIKTKILGVSISSSNICNYKCIYCYAGMQKPKENELCLEEQQSILTQAEALGAKTVVICGDGEPTLDKNLLSMVSHAAKIGMNSIIVTNGALFGDDTLSQKIFKMDGESALQYLYNNNASLIVKLESLDQEKYETIVGVKGAYGKFRKAVERMAKIGFNKMNKTRDDCLTRLAFSAVIMKNNIEELATLKEFADKMYAQFICKLPSLVGRALENIDNMFEVAEYEKIRKKLFGYTAKRETLMVDTPRCMAWHYGPCIDVTGEIRECYTSACPANKRIGNIRETPLKELIRKKNELYDPMINDFCPVKTRINKEFQERGMAKIWNIME
jgi:MoaA/NifB/PqqE/SkfB family radical SAM enzyme